MSFNEIALYNALSAGTTAGVVSLVTMIAARRYTSNAIKSNIISYFQANNTIAGISTDSVQLEQIAEDICDTAKHERHWKILSIIALSSVLLFALSLIAAHFLF